MKIIFIGAGNLATNMAMELKKYSHDIVQIYSQTIESAQLLAKKTGSKATNNIEEIAIDADIYIFSVKDSVLASLLAKMHPNDGIWVHTAGSLSLDIFKEYSNKCGVVYPLQTFNKNRSVDFKKIPLFVEANTKSCFDILFSVFNCLSDNVVELSSEKRKYLHLTGVFACNFVNHMYRISEEILQSVDIPFEVLIPLIDKTASKIHEMKPKDAQTGPAIRFDENVINKHLSLLSDNKRKAIYKIISEDIHESNKE